MRFIPLTLVILLFAIVLGAYSFLINSIQKGVDQASGFVERSESLTKRDAVSRSMQVFLNDTQKEREELSKYVAGESDVVSVIELIESVARDEKVSISISNVSVVPVEGWNHHEAIDVSFSASGTFSRMARFIAVLEALPIASSLKGVSLEVSEKGEWFGSFGILFAKEK